ncbi:hypothetical protein JZ751_003811 [Albula glossodonta]|uniref:Rho-GAP domain-containing protein n=1 Tax=Albula glossodonta TaxID=121402 RepID=A0A8T2P7X9_9TELE|nr:hypothetical protein JZ751_003811 [Albula glossodonta]
MRERGREGRKLDTGDSCLVWSQMEESPLSGVRKDGLSRGRSMSQESQESLDSGSMDDYWSEMKSIEEAGHGIHEELQDRHSSDDAELEEAWLQEAGLSTLVSGEPGDGPTEALLSTLTKKQAAMVRRRLDNYTQTLRKRNKQPIRHVRDVFSTADTSVIGTNSHKFQNLMKREDLSLPATMQPLHTQLVHKVPLPPPPPLPPTPTPNPNPTLPTAETRVSDCGPLWETLSFDVPYSEGVTTHRKGRDCHDCQRIRRDDLPPKLGLTRVRDLSSEDMKKISYFSLIELTTFYDSLGIDLKRNRTVRNKGRETGVFGVPLTTLLENDRKIIPGSHQMTRAQKLHQAPSPPQLFWCVGVQTGLQTEGILRVPGSASRVKHLRQELESKFYDGQFDWDQVRHNDAAGLLKMFIRELPCPLLTLQHLPAFTASADTPAERAPPLFTPRRSTWRTDTICSAHTQYTPLIQALHLLIMLLPEPNRDTLKALLEFLRKVVANEEKNRMSLWNVSMIVAPNLFITRGKSAKLEDMQGAAGTAHLVRLLITNQDLLWTVPCFLISNVRKMNEASMSKKPPTSEKTKRKLLRRWNAERDKAERSEVSDLRDGVIRVHAPLNTKVSMAIKLDSETKAKDVVAHFDSESRPPQHKQKIPGISV